MVWDRGTWEAEGDAKEAYERGRISFTLHGEKLKGKWHLIRTSKGKRSAWVLFKGADDEARRKEKPIVETMPNSVISGRSLEEIAGPLAKPRRRGPSPGTKARR
jgi:bifunctional non-homologous end joining protein LigD